MKIAPEVSPVFMLLPFTFMNADKQQSHHEKGRQKIYHFVNMLYILPNETLSAKTIDKEAFFADLAGYISRCSAQPNAFTLYFSEKECLDAANQYEYKSLAHPYLIVQLDIPTERLAKTPNASAYSFPRSKIPDTASLKVNTAIQPDAIQFVRKMESQEYKQPVSHHLCTQRDRVADHFRLTEHVKKFSCCTIF